MIDWAMSGLSSLFEFKLLYSGTACDENLIMKYWDGYTCPGALIPIITRALGPRDSKISANPDFARFYSHARNLFIVSAIYFQDFSCLLFNARSCRLVRHDKQVVRYNITRHNISYSS